MGKNQLRLREPFHSKIVGLFERTFDAFENVKESIGEYFERRREVKAWKEGLFYTKVRNVRLKLEPLETYFAFQRYGYERFDEIVKSIVKRPESALEKRKTEIDEETVEETPLQEFHRVMREVFGVVSVIIDRKRGLNMLEMIVVYLRFFSFLIALKKKHTGLQGFAPSLEARWNLLKASKVDTADLQDKSLRSDFQKTSPEQAEPQDLQVITEPQEQTAE